MDYFTDFGFEKIPLEEKVDRVQGLFSRVASRYNLMNDLMSFGLHHLWKAEMVKRVFLKPHARLLDVAGGTGDIAYRLLKKGQFLKTPLSITLCDLNVEMMEEGKASLLEKGITKEITWVQGNAEHLPFKEGAFDVYTIAFGLRNITDKFAALKEARRVLRANGKFYCLEFSKVQNSLLKQLYECYSFKVVPRIGACVAQDKAAYQYLVESIERFEEAPTLKEMLHEAGFENVHYELMNNGIVALHIAS